MTPTISQAPETECSQFPDGSTQKSVVQTLESLQSFTVPAHPPAPLQRSFSVQTRPSSQEVVGGA